MKDRFVSYLTRADKDASGVPTLNTHLKQNGFTTVSLGKVFHHKSDNASGWTTPPWRPSGGAYRLTENQNLHAQRQKQGPNFRGPAWEAAPVDDLQYGDGMLAAKAIAELKRLDDQDEPFFLAVGFFKPHLPFVAPQKYWEMYEPSEIQVPETYHIPEDAPPESIHNSAELRAYAGIPKDRVLPAETARQLIHGYYACVSFVDAQVGKVLDELERSGLADNTIVVLWGDHGWNLGEHTLWCKHSCYETSMQIPLLVRVPGVTADRCRSLIETIDLYPTLCELTSTPLPNHLQGRSLVPLLHDSKSEWKTMAIGRYQNGDTIRTDRFRFTEYTDQNNETQSMMLYDHAQDPAEDQNIAAPSNEVSQKLSQQLWQHAGDGKGR